MESLYIKNFGPIKEISIDDIKKFTVLIGESGSGKSTIMKVLALFRWLYKMINIRSFLRYSGIKKSPFRFMFVNMLKTSGMLGYLRTDTIFRYSNGACELEWDANSKKLKGTDKYIPKNELSLEKISFISDKRNIIPDILDHNVSIKRDMFYAVETYTDFEMALKNVKSVELLNLGVSFVAKKTQQGLKYSIVHNKDNNQGVKLNEASSGTQNLVPVSVIVEYYSHYYDLVSSINNAILSYVAKSDTLSNFKAVNNIGDFPYKNVHLIIEEPELSLYPSSQRELMDYLISNLYGDLTRDYSMSLIMATHSPYIVNYINVLLRRNKQTSKASLQSSDLSVYRVSNGQIQNLVGEDSKTGETIVNTMDLSEEMQEIYEEYIALGHHERTI